MTPALKTPDTIARIRRESVTRHAADIARDLGWSLEMLRRLAWEQRIELVNAHPTMPAQEAAPVRDESKPLCVDPALDALAETVGKREGRVLRILMRASQAEDMISSEEIIRADGNVDCRASILRAIENLRKSLSESGLPWEITAWRGRGFRLVRKP